MNFANNRGGGRRQDDEMSMEDILMSIRKYVAEEGAESSEKAIGKDFDDSQKYQPELSSGNFKEDKVISLSGDYVVTNNDDTGSIDENEIPRATAPHDSIRYTEQSDLVEDIATVPQKKGGPFDKLTDALKAYGKEKGDNGGRKDIEKEIIYKFIKSIAADEIKQWISDNLREIATEFVVVEIEKLKSEG
ncbi:MAG: hypothetical protein LBJ92_01090 [Holosporales bacterium]|jgi:hypothetical protein|nr:hypothetical protein [Holosporales bacterium]